MLSHGWEFCNRDAQIWLPAQVPGQVHLDLVRNGIIAHPYQNAFELGCQWVDQENWNYRTNFQFNPDANLPEVFLFCEGLDTVATLYLNDQEVGTSNNMFVPLELDVSRLVREGENQLEIRFQSPVKVGETRRKAYFAENKISDQVASFDERAFVRKAPYMSGWDWGPRLVSCGIWKPIYLVQKNVQESLLPQAESVQPSAEFKRIPDQYGESFEFYQNGRKLWIRGANWIPDTCFPSELRADWLRKSLDAYQSAGINMLRVWGGGVYESDLFYELCQERNILVWQDFLFACSYYPEDPDFLKSVEAEARCAILRLRKHPNLVLWCGNNENHTMWDAPWQQGEKRPKKYYGQVIYEQILPRLVKELDPSRPYIPSSPIGGKKANDDGIGDNHVWDVWHGRGDWRHYEESNSRFASEFGFASAPCEKTWQEAIGTVDVEPDSWLVRHHDKTVKPWETFQSMVELHYPKSETLPDWIYYSQLNQRDAMKAALEHYRRSEFCSGTLIWQANDCWPVQSWSLFDYKVRPKAAAFELKRIHHDLLLSLHRKKEKFHVTLINDGIAEVTGSIKIHAHHLKTGALLRETQFLATIGAGARKEFGVFDISGLNSSETLVSASFGHINAWALLTEPKLARFADPSPIKAKLLNGAIELEFVSPVVDLMLTCEGDPSSFLSNFLTVSEPKTVSVNVNEGDLTKMAARSLSGRHKMIW